MAFPEGDWRASWPNDVKADWVAEQATMAAKVDEVVAGRGLTRPAACLAYVLGDARVSAAIPGSADPDHVRANAAASGGPGLEPAVRRRLNDLWRARAIHGTYNGSG
jgi:aryl-alcohol dehydrogenase-like predicted oxidoreductase